MSLYPNPGQESALQGLYLAHDIREQSASGERAFVYTNFVTSLDGRIAIERPDGSGLTVPSQTANPRDWRLFQELAVQADILITTGRYLRDYAGGRAQEILRVYDDPDLADLAEWRAGRGLNPMPDLAVISRQLDFPIPATLLDGERSVVFVTTADAAGSRSREFEKLGKVVIAGEERVEGVRLVDGLSALGYKTIYSTAGPKVMHMLLHAGMLDRLYLTLVSRVLGGERFATITEGAPLDPPASFRLGELYYDSHAPDGAGQLFAMYERADGEG